MLGLAVAVDHDGGVVLVDDDLLGAAEIFPGHVLELDAEVLGDHLAAGEDPDVLEHGLAAIAEAGGLDGADVEGAAQLVDHQRGEGLALDVLGDDQQRGLPCWAVFSRIGSRSFMFEIFFSKMRITAILSSTTSMRSASVTK